MDAAEEIDGLNDGASIIYVVVHDWGSPDPFCSDGPGGCTGFVGRNSTDWRHERVRVFRHDPYGRRPTRGMRGINHESTAVVRRE